MFTRSWWWRIRSIFKLACAGLIGAGALVSAAACSDFSNSCEQLRNCPLSSSDARAALDASFASGGGGVGGGGGGVLGGGGLPATSGGSRGAAGTAGGAATVTTHSDAGTRPSSDLDASDAAPSVRDGSLDATGDAQSGEGDSGRAADGALLCRS